MHFYPTKKELSGKGLARCRAVRFQPLPMSTAREVFPQAAHPANFIERVMGRVEWRGLSRYTLRPGQWLDFPAPVQPEYIVEIFVTPSPPSDARLSPPLASGQKDTH